MSIVLLLVYIVSNDRFTINYHIITVVYNCLESTFLRGTNGVFSSILFV